MGVADTVPRVRLGHSLSLRSVNSRSHSNGRSIPDLTPNLVLLWYFFTEIFDHFSPFLSMAFLVLRHPTCGSNHAELDVLAHLRRPLLYQVQYDPLYAVFILTGVLGTVKAYPTLSDSGLFFKIVSHFPEVLSCQYKSPTASPSTFTLVH